MLDASARQGIVKPIRLVLVDPQPIVLQGLRSVLGTQPDFDVVASSSDGTSCLEAIRNLTPDVALLADKVPDLTVSEILAIVKAEKLSTRLVFFAESDVDHDLTAAVAAGACSAISKYASPTTLLQSLRLMTKSGVSLERSDLAPTGEEAEGGDKIEKIKIGKMLEQLTHRERQIVRLVSEGMSNKEIARQLNVSPGTVKVHLYNIFQKLEITNRTVLATLALLKRPSGIGTLSLALLALAVADELKASEANDISPDDSGIGHTGEHAGYEPWKKAILRYLIASESGEASVLNQRDAFVKASQVTNPAAAMEALRAAEQSVGSTPWKHSSSVGSTTPNLPAPALRIAGVTQIGGDAAPEHQIPRLASNPMLIHGGHGNFAALAGALIYALDDPHITMQARDPGHASVDSVLAVSGEYATTKVADMTHADANHVNGSVPGFLTHDFHLPSAVATTANDHVAQEGARGQMGPGAAGDDLQKPIGVLDAGHDASIGGYSRDQMMGGNVENVVYRSPTDSKSGSSDSVFDFASGPSRINLAAFGALAWLHMTAASKSIPPHTLAWVYNSASDEMIVYVNPTDHVLDIGDRGLLEIHLQGIVAIAEADVVSHPDGAAVPITLEQLEAALTSATATDESALSTKDFQTSVGTSEGAVGTAGVWSVLADDGLRLQFGQTRTGSRASTSFGTSTSDSADETDDGAGASGVSAHVSSPALGHGATAPAVENLTSKSEPINADIGVLPTKQNEIVAPDAAPAGSADHGNSQHASEPGSAKEAPETAHAKSVPDNGVGNDDKHHSLASDASPGSAQTAEPGGVEHSHAGRSSSANAPEAAESAATAGGAHHGNSQYASEPGSAKEATAELADADFILGDGGDGGEHHAQASDPATASAVVKTAEQVVVEHGKSEHDSPATSAKAPAADIVEPSVASGDNAADGNSQRPGQSATTAIEAARPAKAGSETAGADQELVFRFGSEATHSSLVAVVEPKELHSPHLPPGVGADLDIIVQNFPTALDDHAVNHGNNGPHHAIVPAPHDLLI